MEQVILFRGVQFIYPVTEALVFMLIGMSSLSVLFYYTTTCGHLVQPGYENGKKNFDPFDL